MIKVRRGDPCTIADCGKPVVGRGWCARHYGIWRAYGDPLYPVRPYARQGEKCAHDGCDKAPERRGFCEKHVRRLLGHGETTEPYKRRFWAQVDRRGDEECWPWTGWTQPNGYGSYGARATGTRLVHRIAYQMIVGPIPDGLVLDHLCHTRDPQCADTKDCPHRKCCNPAHLEPVTRRENIARGRGGDSWGYESDPVPVRPARLSRPATCTEDGCDRGVYKRSICRPHYRKWLKDPEVERPSQRTPERRFWAKVDKNGPVPQHCPDLGACWLWAASINRGTGYGQFGVRHGVMVGAHQFSYELAHGSIPDGHDVHHTCHVRRCVNPDHLRALTRSENLRLRKTRR